MTVGGLPAHTFVRVDLVVFAVDNWSLSDTYTIVVDGVTFGPFDKSSGTGVVTVRRRQTLLPVAPCTKDCCPIFSAPTLLLTGYRCPPPPHPSITLLPIVTPLTPLPPPHDF